MNEFTTAELQAINFALTFTYWLHKSTQYKPENLGVLQSKIIREFDSRNYEVPAE
jgi:hypothetical protein